jgi:hypothetical protein
MGMLSNTLVTNETVNNALIASEIDAKPYMNTTAFLFDLNHKKNRTPNNPVISTAVV